MHCRLLMRYPTNKIFITFLNEYYNNFQPPALIYFTCSTIYRPNLDKATAE